MPLIQVNANIFSGRLNPHWQLAGAEAEKILRGLNALPLAQGAGPSPLGLGYSGLNLIVEEDGQKRQGHVFGGFVVLGGAVWRDEGRVMERALIKTAQQHLSPAAYTELHDIFMECL